MIKAHKSVEKPDRAVEESTRRVSFLGTPFEGSDIAAWAQLGRRFFSLFQDTNAAILEELKKPESHQLSTITDDFASWLRGREGETSTKVEIVCIAEEKVTGSLGKVSCSGLLPYDVSNKLKIVTDSSAHLKGYKTMTFCANHEDMCKCSGRDDSKYKSLSELLQGWVKVLKEEAEAKKPETVSTACLDVS